MRRMQTLVKNGLPRWEVYRTVQVGIVLWHSAAR